MKPEIKERIEKIKMGQVPEGYKKTKLGIVPREWEIKFLSELLKFQNGINADKDKYNSGIKMISIMDILSNMSIYYDNIRGQVDIDEKQLNIYGVTYGDVLFQRSSEIFEDVGKSNVYLDKEKIATYSGFVIRGKKIAEYNPIYFNELLKIQSVRKQIIRSSAGAQHINISQSSLSKIMVHIANMNEQQKIADILSTQDKIIELKEKLIDEKQKQKKYLMQTLLTGKKRLKGFDGEWKEKSISNVFKITRGNVLATADIKTEKNEDYVYPVYSSQTKNNGLLGYYNKSLYRDAITWTTDGANAGFVAFRKGKFYCTNVCGVLLDEKGNANECIAQILNSKTKYYVSYVGNPKLMNGIMGKIKIKFPPLEEQIAIANILSTQDKEIELLQQDLEQEKQKKKVLMQLLLTGIVRVKY